MQVYLKISLSPSCLIFQQFELPMSINLSPRLSLSFALLGPNQWKSNAAIKNICFNSNADASSILTSFTLNQSLKSGEKGYCREYVLSEPGTASVCSPAVSSLFQLCALFLWMSRFINSSPLADRPSSFRNCPRSGKNGRESSTSGRLLSDNKVHKFVQKVAMNCSTAHSRGEEEGRRRYLLRNEHLVYRRNNKVCVFLLLFCSTLAV